MTTRDGHSKKSKNGDRVSRRRLLQTSAVLAVAPVAYASGSYVDAAQPARQSVYESLGLKHIINATGTVTNLAAPSCRRKW